MQPRHTNTSSRERRPMRSVERKEEAIRHQRTKRILVLGIVGCCLLVTTPSASAVPRRVRAFAGARVRAPVLGPVAGQNVFKRKPRTRDKMKWGWLVGADGAGEDGTSGEQKFNFVGAGAGRIPVPRGAFGGFAKAAGPGIYGSTAFSNGAGSSAIIAGARKPYQVDWTVNVGGALGNINRPTWRAHAVGSDPFHIIADDMIEGGFSSEATVDITFPVGLTSAIIEGGDLEGAESSAAFDVAINLNGTPYSLFSMFADATGVLVPEIDFALLPFDVTIHHVTTLDDDPIPGVTDITIGGIRSLLTTDFADGTLDTPLLLAFELRNVDVSEIMAGSAILSANLEARAGDAGAFVPEPTTLSLLALGGLLLSRRRR